MKTTITTFNILADAYIRKDWYPHTDPKDLESERRAGVLKAELTKTKSDIFCLQEVEPVRFDSIAEWLGSTFSGHFVQKAGKPEGCAIFYSNDLDLIETSELRFKNVSDGRNQVAALATFERDGFRFGVASTHLQSMRETTSRSEHLGRLQLIELIEKTDESNYPWILCGDLNAISQSVVLDAAHERGYLLSCRQQRPWDSTNINGKRRKIDYLLYKDGTFTTSPHSLVKLERETPMPSSVHASDHLPITVDFVRSNV